MALQKELVLNNGFTCNYHKITSYTYDSVHKRCMVSLAVYKDKETRDANKENVTNKSVMLEDVETDPTRASIYVLLKTKSEYADSVDL